MKVLTLRAAKQDAEGALIVQRYATFEILTVGGQSGVDRVPGVVNGDGVEENPITANIAGLAKVGAPDGDYDVLKTNPDGSTERETLTWFDERAARDVVVVARDQVLPAAESASADADRAEIAADEADNHVGIFTDAATGNAAVSEGQFFSVPSPIAGEDLIRYQKVGGSPVEKKRTISSAGAKTLVSNVQRDVGGPDLHNQLTESESLYSDLALVVTDRDCVLSTEIYNGRRVIKATPGVSGAVSISIQYLPLTIFQLTGKISASVLIEQADAGATGTPIWFIRQTAEGMAGSSIQVDQQSVSSAAISDPTWVSLDDKAVNGAAKRLAFTLRRNGAAIRVSRIVITNGSVSLEVPLNLLRDLDAISSQDGAVLPLRNIQRTGVDWANNEIDTYDPRYGFNASTGMTIGAGNRNLYMMQTDYSFRAGVPGEVVLRATKLTATGIRFGFAVGQSGKSNTSRRAYVWNIDGLVQDFPGNFIGATTVFSANALRAFAVSDVISIRLLRRADGTGQIGVTPASGIEYTAELTGIPLGRIWMAWRVDSGVGALPLELQQISYHPAIPVVGVNLEPRVSATEAVLFPTTPVLLQQRVLPDSAPGRSVKGFTCTGARRITQGKYAGFYAIGDDGRIKEGDGSPYDPAVHIVDDPFFGQIIKTFPMPWTNATIQGVEIRSVGAVDTLLVVAGWGNSLDGANTIREIRLYDDGGGLAGSEVVANRFDWAAAGFATNSANAPNGICRVPELDASWVCTQSSNTMRLISCVGAVDPLTRVLQTGTGPTAMDQLLWRDARVYFSTGGNTELGSIRRWNPVTGNSADVYLSLPLSYAIEGFIFRDQTSELDVFCDVGYHDNGTAVPAFNAIKRYQVKLPTV